MTRIKAPARFALTALLFCWSICPAIYMSAQGADALVMVVSAASGSQLSKPEAKRMLLGQSASWPNGSKVTVVMKAAGSKDRNTVLQYLCGMSEAEYTRFQMQLAFTGQPATALHQADSAAATKSFLKATPGAVGFLHASEVDASVKVVLTFE